LKGILSRAASLSGKTGQWKKPSESFKDGSMEGMSCLTKLHLRSCSLPFSAEISVEHTLLCSAQQSFSESKTLSDQIFSKDH